MRITKEYIKEKAVNNDLNWLQNTTTSRLIYIIKTKKLAEPEVSFLWGRRELRWDLARNQQLPDPVVDFIIENSNKHSKIEISKAIFTELFKKQEFTNNKILEILNSPKIDFVKYFIIWGYKYKQLSKIDGQFEQYLDYYFKYYADTDEKSFIEVIRNVPNALKQFIDKFIEVKDTFFYVVSILQLLVKHFYLEDSILEKLEDNFRLQIREVSPYLIARDHCSDAKKAKFLLLKR